MSTEDYSTPRAPLPPRPRLISVPAHLWDDFIAHLADAGIDLRECGPNSFKEVSS